MDLSFARSLAPPASAIPVELAVLLAGIATVQAASNTARVQHGMVTRQPTPQLLRTASGAFCPLTAIALTRWQGE